MIRYNAPGVQQTEREISGGRVSVWDGPHEVEDHGRRYAVSRSVEINRGKRGVSVAYVIRAAAVSLALAAMLSGCGERKAPPYRWVSIQQGNTTAAGDVVSWSEEIDGKIRLELEREDGGTTVYYADRGEITATRGWMD